METNTNKRITTVDVLEQIGVLFWFVNGTDPHNQERDIEIVAGAPEQEGPDLVLPTYLWSASLHKWIDADEVSLYRYSDISRPKNAFSQEKGWWLERLSPDELLGYLDVPGFLDLPILPDEPILRQFYLMHLWSKQIQQADMTRRQLLTSRLVKCDPKIAERIKKEFECMRPMMNDISEAFFTDDEKHRLWLSKM